MSITLGKTIKEFTTKSGKKAVLRYPTMDDTASLLTFINEMSLEDTFIRFSGEQQTMEEEAKYLQSEVDKIVKGDVVKLFCFVDGEFAGVCDISRDLALATRRRHVGILGIIIGKAFRGDGIGYTLMATCIEEAKKEIQGLRLVHLDCFATNTPALGLYKKIGFTEWGNFPSALYRKGEYVDEVHMALSV